MTTKKLLVAFDPEKPDRRSSDFLIVVLDGAEVKLLGINSNEPVKYGLLVHVGKEIKVNDLFAKLVDTGRKIESVRQTLRSLEHYIKELQGFRIGNLLGIEADPVNGFKLAKMADVPPGTGDSKLP